MNIWQSVWKGLVCLVLAGVALTTFAADERQRETFRKWHVGVGAAFNGGVRAQLGPRNLPVPAVYSVPAILTKEKALENANAHRYDGGGRILPDSSNVEPDPHDWFDTENWQLPRSDYQGNGEFLLNNAYEEILGSSFAPTASDSSDSEMQYGVSLDISREIWIHDENEEHRWGVDFAAAFSYFFKRDIYSARGNIQRTDTVMEGVVRTEVNDPAATYDYDPDNLPEMLGDMNLDRTAEFHPALGWDTIGNPFVLDDRPTHSVDSSRAYGASGDYQELEMLFMLRPWYEIKDWWRVYAEVGVGVSWGRFDTSFHSGELSYDEDFAQWDCYGVAGLGTVFRYGDWTLGVDFLGRFLRDDLDVDGRYVSGSIERSNWGFRVMLGYEF